MLRAWRAQARCQFPYQKRTKRRYWCKNTKMGRSCRRDLLQQGASRMYAEPQSSAENKRSLATKCQDATLPSRHHETTTSQRQIDKSYESVCTRTGNERKRFVRRLSLSECMVGSEVIRTDANWVPCIKLDMTHSRNSKHQYSNL